MTTPEVEVHLERLEELWDEIEQEWRELRTYAFSGATVDRVGREYSRHSEMYVTHKAILKERVESVQLIGWPTSVYPGIINRT